MMSSGKRKSRQHLSSYGVLSIKSVWLVKQNNSALPLVNLEKGELRLESATPAPMTEKVKKKKHYEK